MPLSQMVHKLAGRVELDAADRRAVMALPYETRAYLAGVYIVREGEPPRSHCPLILSGFAYRQKSTLDGLRQIVSLHMAGDLVDLQHLFLDVADHSIQALTRLETVTVETGALRELVLERPNVARALWIEALIDASIYREWVTNVGRRSARTRIAHVLCEFALRLKAAGLAADDGFELPMTQDQLADMVGLTPVHVNRTLRDLARDGVVERDKRRIRFTDWKRVAREGDFSPLYLHLGEPAERGPALPPARSRESSSPAAHT